MSAVQICPIFPACGQRSSCWHVLALEGCSLAGNLFSCVGRGSFGFPRPNTCRACPRSLFGL